MRSNFLTYFSLAILSLCLWIGCTNEVRAQEISTEVMLRDGTVMKAHPSMELVSDYVDLGDGRKVERSKVSLICLSDCKDAPRDSSQNDLVVLKDERHKLGEITRIEKSQYNPFKPGVLYLDNVDFSHEKIPFSEINYIKFSDHVFYSLQQAVRAPAIANRLVITYYKRGVEHLSPKLGRLTNLKELDIACLEDLKDLPTEIGNLRKLEKLIIDNGNGCGMNISIPVSIGQLQHLKVLRLYGALDARDIDSPGPIRPAKGKSLPKTIADLRNLEELDLGRNGIGAVPPQIASLPRLKKLGLDYNNIHEIPSFISSLKSLQELSVMANDLVKLPQSLAGMRGLKVYLGNNSLKLKDQEKLRRRFPKIVFDFSNDVDDGRANEEAPEPKPMR
jgi:hypothetical protein